MTLELLLVTLGVVLLIGMVLAVGIIRAWLRDRRLQREYLRAMWRRRGNG
jgi:uncharacterized protein YneF (UPF0154 family)